MSDIEAQEKEKLILRIEGIIVGFIFGFFFDDIVQLILKAFTQP